MESIDALDWMEDKNPLEHIKNSVRTPACHLEKCKLQPQRFQRIKTLESSSYGGILKGKRIKSFSVKTDITHLKYILADFKVYIVCIKNLFDVNQVLYPCLAFEALHKLQQYF